MKEVAVRIPLGYNPSDTGVSRAQYAGEGYDWGQLQLYIDRVHALGITGKGVTIGVIDTGFYKGHPDLDDDCLYRDFTKDRNPHDLNGHGTHVRGIIGMKPNGTGLIGMAPDAKIHVAKSLGGRAGFGSSKNLFDALALMIREVKPDWINMSLSLSEPIPDISFLLEEAFRSGIGIVAAAGNFAEDKVTFPGSHPKAIAVGAVDQYDKLAAFSNRGKALKDLSVVAPGVQIRSSWIDGNYRNSDGTSMAAPFVTGMAALITQRLRDLKQYAGPSAVQLLLESFAKDLGEPGTDLKYGHGRITADWFGVDTVEDDKEKCKNENPKIFNPNPPRGCLGIFLR